MEKLSSSQLIAILEDTQASLAAALGRIEAFRMREKQLMNELSQLRQQVHGSSSIEETQTATPRGAKPAAALPASAPAPMPAYASTSPRMLPNSAAESQIRKPSEVLPGWTSPSSQPVYVTDCDGDYPIHIITGTKKVPGSLLVTPEYVDFVEVKARVRQEEFVGISTVKIDSLAGRRRGSGMGVFFCCAAPSSEDATFSDMDATGAGAGAGGGCKDEAEARNGQGAASSSGNGGCSGVWQILWSKNGTPQRQAFEASRATREALHRHTQRWLGEVDSGPVDGSASAESGEIEIAVPRNLTVGDDMLRFLGEPPAIVNDLQMRALASAIPPLDRMRDWTLSYSTAKHGISLQTLYRRAINGVPTILLIKDFGGFTFGAFTPDSWRVAPRYYGSGETFVFQLEPYRVAYPWRSMNKVKNDFFQYGTPECLAVGGVGHFAIWVDADLLAGSSGICGTFGSPCLAHGEEFRLQQLEMWQAVQ